MYNTLSYTYVRLLVLISYFTRHKLKTVSSMSDSIWGQVPQPTPFLNQPKSPGTEGHCQCTSYSFQHSAESQAFISATLTCLRTLQAANSAASVRTSALLVAASCQLLPPVSTALDSAVRGKAKIRNNFVPNCTLHNMG